MIVSEVSTVTESSAANTESLELDEATSTIGIMNDLSGTLLNEISQETSVVHDGVLDSRGTGLDRHIISFHLIICFLVDGDNNDNETRSSGDSIKSENTNERQGSGSTISSSSDSDETGSLDFDKAGSLDDSIMCDWDCSANIYERPDSKLSHSIEFGLSVLTSQRSSNKGVKNNRELVSTFIMVSQFHSI